MRFISTDAAPRAIGPYSQGTVSGGLLFTAGQIALDPTTMTVMADGVTEQTERVFANLRAILTAAQTDLSRVVKATVYLTDMADFSAMNAVYEEEFGNHRPARSTVAVASLPKGVRVEIDLIAEVG